MWIKCLKMKGEKHFFFSDGKKLFFQFKGILSRETRRRRTGLSSLTSSFSLDENIDDHARNIPLNILATLLSLLDSNWHFAFFGQNEIQRKVKGRTSLRRQDRGKRDVSCPLSLAFISFSISPLKWTTIHSISHHSREQTVDDSLTCNSFSLHRRPLTMFITPIFIIFIARIQGNKNRFIPKFFFSENEVSLDPLHF